jgi:hypothetical protein
MALKLNPAPTYADPVIVDETSGKAKFNPLWLKWFLDVVQILNNLLTQSANGVVNHELLAGLLGGDSANGHYHLTLTQNNNAQTLLALTVPGADSLVFYDVSANGYAILTLGDGLNITGTTIDAKNGTSLTLTGDITTGTGTLHKTTTNLTNGAAAAAGTLNNAPAAGNPSKWVPINDNGTVRYIPCW